MLKDFMNCIITPGIHDFREKNNCYWLISDTIVLAMLKGLKNGEHFLNCELKVNKNDTAILTIDNGNGKKLYKQKYEWTDLKIKTFKYYAVLNELGTYTIMLPEEY